MAFCPWKKGDRVRFAHQLETGPSHTIISTFLVNGDWMVEINDMPGNFAAHIFRAEDYPSDSIVPRPAR